MRFLISLFYFLCAFAKQWQNATFNFLFVSVRPSVFLIDSYNFLEILCRRVLLKSVGSNSKQKNSDKSKNYLRENLLTLTATLLLPGDYKKYDAYKQTNRTMNSPQYGATYIQFM